jgi:hypothetical protein
MSPRLLNYDPSQEHVLIIRIGPIILFMGYPKNPHLIGENTQVYFTSPLHRHEIIINIEQSI